MTALRTIVSFKEIGVLLSLTVCLIRGEHYIVSNIINQNVQHVNKVFVSTHFDSAIKCAAVCRNLNCTSFSYGEKLVRTTPECFATTTTAYNGRQTRTSSGEICQRWDTTIPHSHSLNRNSDFPDATVTDAANFCRNPRGFRRGPWCFTTNPDIQWEYCSISPCDFEFQHRSCYNDTLKTKDYIGTWSRTRSGKVCQRWDAQSPHSHAFTSSSGFPDNTLSDAENYCRDPSDLGYTWCYTIETGTVWEACDVTSCTKYVNDMSCYEGASTDYRGTWDVSVDNLECQRWDSQTPKPHPFIDTNLFPEDTLEDAENFCRDVKGFGSVSCIMMMPNYLLRSCNIWKCPPNHVTCYDSPTVRSYMGTWSKTESRKVCQRWDSQQPHSHNLTADMFEEDTLTDAENFCRDPTGTGELWCYTTDPKTPTESCGIGHCSGVNTCQVYKDETLYEGSRTSEHYTKEP